MPVRPDLLKVPERHKGKRKMSQKRITLGLNGLLLRFRRRQLRLQLAHARDARVSYNIIRRHSPIPFQP